VAEREYEVHEPIEAPKRQYTPGTVVPISARVTMIGTKDKLVMLRAAKERAKASSDRAVAGKKKKADERHARGEYKWQDMRLWFEEGCRNFIGLSHLPSWRPQDRENARRLLKEFGGATTKAASIWMFEHWEAYVTSSKGRLHGIPTPSLMIAMKSQIFPDCERNKVPGQDTSRRDRVRSSEWDEDAKPELNPDGWGLD